MCGIAGFIVGRHDLPANTLVRMMDAQNHRGPDDRGAIAIRPRTGERVADEARLPEGWKPGDIGLGHVRLSIIDRSQAGRQPMSIDNGRLDLIYNGEIYNYIELREELISLGHRFTTRTDTEVLLRAYEQWGEECLRHLNGMWSFALWDRARGMLFCAIDQFGIKPFHYTETDAGFGFASELKAVVELPYVTRELNRNRATLFLVAGFDHGTDETFYRNIKRLLPGESLTVRPGEPARVQRWWRVAPQATPRSEAEAVARIREILRDSIRLRYRSDVPVGVALSGGVDSTGIACHVHDMAESGQIALPNGLRTFTARTSDRRIDEGRLASLTAGIIGAQQYTVSPDGRSLATADLPRLVRSQDEPFSSLSIYMQYCLMRRVRESGTTVVLSGQGADEMFLGYPWHSARTFNAALEQGKVAEAIRLARASVGGGDSALEFAGYAISEALPTLSALRRSYRSLPYVRRALVSWEARATLASAVAPTAMAALAHETEVLGLPGLLRYEDRNAMAFSVESRLPYLDYRLVNLAHSLPGEMKLHRGWRKALLRQAIEDVAPAEVIWRRKKIGFAAPDSEFLHALRGIVSDTFAGDIRAGDLLNKKTVVARAQGSAALGLHVWRALNLELWMREFRVTVGR